MCVRVCVFVHVSFFFLCGMCDVCVWVSVSVSVCVSVCDCLYPFKYVYSSYLYLSYTLEKTLTSMLGYYGCINGGLFLCLE